MMAGAPIWLVSLMATVGAVAVLPFGDRVVQVVEVPRREGRELEEFVYRDGETHDRHQHEDRDHRAAQFEQGLRR